MRKAKKITTVPSVFIGEGATLGIGSDRYPATVVSISESRRRIILQEDSAVLISGDRMSEHQVYEYDQNLAGEEYTAFWSDKKDRWMVTKNRAIGGGYAIGGWLSIGERCKYIDPSF